MTQKSVNYRVSTRVLGTFKLNFIARKINLPFNLAKSMQKENLVVFLLVKSCCAFWVNHAFMFLQDYSSSNSKPDQSTLPIL